ncbi:uncharacterized protein SCODWIG_01478 [Saccharomycodes ludwigii]|uniref:Rho-GAP domain-containing protein n=1 Tax=Saccharomycodes ludwigii TaxID=36035 RepID=A0A376B4U8_9ASCO|nr:hypothetical protein SCDLUD_003250 [Saccharomycodes ludwigii]KAH3900278.1 hypothetical protein SCDLUD_003250 [Saccharomycodes ludwigii]SSD59717.1 uncharacterized protein SCODWIG_01478 [Saccharomycodes ludwigii]
METSSPNKNLGSWLKFMNNPKSLSTDSFATPNSNPTITTNNRIGNTRPKLSKSFSSNNKIVLPQQKSQQTQDTLQYDIPNSNNNNNNNNNMASYKQYRDDFLKQRHSFHGRVFGVTLQESLSTASAEVIVQSESVSFGKIPVVVAKCGAFLKSNGLNTQGIFRIAGNSKRVKNLQYMFSTPDYGVKFNNWESFTVHDAATILRRYLNNLEEPLIPIACYNKFREPLISKPRILKNMQRGGSNFISRDQENLLKKQGKELEEMKNSITEQEYRRRRKSNHHKRKLIRDIRYALKSYEKCFHNLNKDSKQLLIYLLDLLSLFSQHSDKNLMTSKNLAAIFQPSILSHPDHDMDPREYEISRYCVEFLIDFSYKLLPHLLKLGEYKANSNPIVAPTPISTVGTTKNNVPKTDHSSNGKLPAIITTTSPSEGANIVNTRSLDNRSIERVGSPMLPQPRKAISPLLNTRKLHVKTTRPHSKSLSSKPAILPDVLIIKNRSSIWMDSAPDDELDDDDYDDDDDDDDDGDYDYYDHYYGVKEKERVKHTIKQKPHTFQHNSNNQRKIEASAASNIDSEDSSFDDLTNSFSENQLELAAGDLKKSNNNSHSTLDGIIRNVQSGYANSADHTAAKNIRNQLFCANANTSNSVNSVISATNNNLSVPNLSIPRVRTKRSTSSLNLNSSISNSYSPVTPIFAPSPLTGSNSDQDNVVTVIPRNFIDTNEQQQCAVDTNGASNHSSASTTPITPTANATHINNHSATISNDNNGSSTTKCTATATNVKITSFPSDADENFLRPLKPHGNGVKTKKRDSWFQRIRSHSPI